MPGAHSLKWAPSRRQGRPIPKRAKGAPRTPVSPPSMPVTVFQDAFHRPLFVTTEDGELRVESIEHLSQELTRLFRRSSIAQHQRMRLDA